MCGKFLFPLALILAIAAAGRAHARNIGTIINAQGNVAVHRGSSAIKPATGVHVDQGDRVTTGSRSHISIVLTDRSEIDIGESTVVVLSEHGIVGGRPHTRIALLAGLVRAIVDTAAGSNNFQINTPNAVASARGTKFDTSYESGAARQGYGACRQFSDIAVYEGIVDVSGASNPSVRRPLSAGYETTVACAGAPLVPAPIGVGSGHFQGLPGSIAAPPPPGAHSPPTEGFPPVTIKPF